MTTVPALRESSTIVVGDATVAAVAAASERKRRFSESNADGVSASMSASASAVATPSPLAAEESVPTDPQQKRRRTASDGDVQPQVLVADAPANVDAAAAVIHSASESEDQSSSDDESVDLAQVAAGVMLKEKPRKPSHVIGHDTFRVVKREDEHHRKPLKIINQMRKNLPARACGRCALCKEAPCGTCKNCLHNTSVPAAGQKKPSKRRCLMLRCEKLKGMTGEQIAQQQNDPTVFKPSAEYKFLLSGLSAIDTMRMNAIKATQANYDDMEKYLFYRMYAECTEEFLRNIIYRYSRDIAVDEATHKYMRRHVPYFMRQDYTIYNHDGRIPSAPTTADTAAPTTVTNERV